MRARARSSRGAAVLEAAFITPVFFMLVFGIVEIGMAMNDYLALSNSVRAGARTGSASGNDLTADWNIIQAIQREGSALPKNQIKMIVVYKASSFGAKPTVQCQGGTPVANVCNTYTPADFTAPKAQWGCYAGYTLDRYWCPLDRKVSLSGTGTDYIGVWMKIEHPWVTKMFGNVKTLTDSSVIRLEPRSRA